MALALKNIHSDISLRVRNEFDHGKEGLYRKRAAAPFIIYLYTCRENFQWAKPLLHLHDFDVCTSVSSILKIKRRPRMATGIRNPDCDFVRDPRTPLMSSNSNHR